MPAPFIVERVDSKSPSRAGFRHNAGRASMALKVTRTDMNTSHWGDVVEYVLGSTDVVATNGGKVKRVLPISAPDYPHMIADQIEEIQGIGVATKATATSPLGVPCLPATALYQKYEMTVSFVPMTFSIFKDDELKLKDGSAFNDDGSTYSFKYYDEYNRYCEWWVEDGFEVIQAQFGSRYFVTGSEAAPHLIPFPGSITDRVPRPVVHFCWKRIPYRYVASRNSWIRKYKGFINQDDFLSWKAGELLYLDAKVTRYLPGIPTMYLDEGTNTFRTHLGALCDVEFLWELREWETTDPPALTNGSQITVRGHNAERWFRAPGQAYLAVSVGADPDDDSLWKTKYASRPFSRMFTDPDVTNPT